jgi:hypothetical protein
VNNLLDVIEMMGMVLTLFFTRITLFEASVSLELSIQTPTHGSCFLS